ncbi:MAG: IS1595 family transposase [Candidatus Angelobacter sp. Gp1-AA117]|nr:MAG: IS1595 family transposase [Candidatus Angelobacter sp. Gp1-AA117]
MEQKTPKTLQQAIQYFSNPDACIQFFVELRWPDGVICPTCGSKDVSYISTRRIWKCKTKHDHRQFSIKVGTIFEDSPLPLEKWIMAMWMICCCKNGVSSYEIHRAIGVTQKSAWFMLHRIRKAMSRGSFLKLGGNGGEVEADETFIGGKARNMHKSVKERRITGQGHNIQDKVIVMGMLERGGRIHTQVITDRKKETLQPIVKKHVEAGSSLYTDELWGYTGLDADFDHQAIDHAIKYVDGRVHTNGMENFWSLLKRMLGGTYVSVEPFHLFRYLDEQVFRYENRATKDNPLNDSDRFMLCASQIAGKRLTYKELTGKTDARQAQSF